MPIFLGLSDSMPLPMKKPDCPRFPGLEFARGFHLHLLGKTSAAGRSHIQETSALTRASGKKFFNALR